MLVAWADLAEDSPLLPLLLLLLLAGPLLGASDRSALCRPLLMTLLFLWAVDVYV